MATVRCGRRTQAVVGALRYAGTGWLPHAAPIHLALAPLLNASDKVMAASNL